MHFRYFERRFRYYLFRFLSPFLKWAGSVHVPFTKHKCEGKHYYEILAKAKVSDIMLSQETGELTDILIPGKVKHAVVYAGLINGIPSVIEAIGEGVRVTDLVSFVTTKDIIYLLSPDIPPEIEQKFRYSALTFVVHKLGLPYDFEVGISDNKFYCSKLAWFAYDFAARTAGIDSLFIPSDVLGVPVVEPQEILSNKKLKLIYSSEGC